MNTESGVALAQINLAVGDIAGNEKRIVEAAVYAREKLDCRVIVFPELAICGYPPEDLLFQAGFVRRCEDALERIKRSVDDIALVIGYPKSDGGHLYNAACVIDRGEIQATYYKHHLPNYGVFDEKRYFTQGSQPVVVDIGGFKAGITICEDVWRYGPVERAVESGANVIFALNGSPFDADKMAHRENEVIAERAKSNKVSIVYVNLVGGQDELVFDGGSVVCDAFGKTVLRAPHFEHSILRASFKRGEQLKNIKGQVAPMPETCEAIYRAVVLGTKDYIEKNGFSGAVLGLSGGIDSALTLAIVTDAIGKENVQAVLMPSRYTRQISLDDAKQQARALNIRWSQISIEPIFKAILNQLADEFQNLPADVTEENIQARCRGTLLMAISNKTGKILVTTGNKSEVAVGYATLYGDMAGGFAPIKDVPKTLVYRLARYRNETFGAVIPDRVIEREPSAELAPEQRDTDSLPCYEALDEILRLYVEQDASAKSIIERGFDSEVVNQVIKMVMRNEYKRRQAPPGVRITTRAFGRDRRFPITNRSAYC